MNTIRLLTDSIANLPHEVIIENQIEVVPVNIIIDDKVYKDTELTLDDYFKLITDAQGKNKLNSNTSFPSPGDFAEAYVRLAEAGATDIISVHVSRKASGIEWSVLTAKTLVESKVRVHFVDSGSAGMARGFMLLEAAEALRKGESVDAAILAIEEVKKKIGLLYLASDLDQLQARGRTNGINEVVESGIKSRALINVSNGESNVVSRHRTLSDGINTLLENLKLWCVRHNLPL